MEEAIRVLLVSDSSKHIQFISRRIKEAKNSTVTYAHTVIAAAKLIHEQSFDLILCDSVLSDRVCLEFLSDVKKISPNLPFILLVDSRKEELAEQALRQGAYDYIVKKKDQLEKIPHLLQNILDRFVLAHQEKRLEEEVARQKASLEEINRKLETLAIHDELTGIFNHRYFQEKLHEEFLRAKRYAHPLSCLMVDIDYFKSVNDVRGHLVGDDVLKELAHLIVELSRPMDVVARYGGEEFVVLLPHVDYEGAASLAERLRKAISKKTFLTGRFDLKLTVSIGVASYPDDALQKHDDLISFSNQALLRAKGNKGRNSVCCYSSMMKEIKAQTPALKFSDDKIAEFRKRLLDVSEAAKRGYIESTKALVYALEAKDKYTLGHASRVAQYSALVAKEMGLADEEVNIIEHAGLLHDVGKICIGDEILLKEGPFTLIEYEKMKEHPVLGYQLIKSIKFLREEALIILHHHEWFDGQGYPHRLKGKEIPIGARIVSVLDAYDTMRVAGARYKKTLPCEETIEDLMKQSGTQFDPEVVAALIRVLAKRGEINAEKLGVKSTVGSPQSTAATQNEK